MEINEAITEWASHRRRMGCVAATNWFCARVQGFKPKRWTYYTADGEPYQHVVATNGIVDIDIAPYNNHPDE